MLVRLAAKENKAISISEIGLDGRTEADGLAVGQASELAASSIRTLVSGVFTVLDDDLFEDVYRLERCEGLRVEPSAVAGFRGPRWLVYSEQGRRYQEDHKLSERMDDATHIVWTTGGAFVPAEEYQGYYERGARRAGRAV